MHRYLQNLYQNPVGFRGPAGKKDGVFYFTKRCDTSVRYGMIVYTSETRATNYKAELNAQNQNADGQERVKK